MTLLNKPHFNTAVSIAIAAVLGWTGASHAQTVTQAAFCDGTQPVNATSMLKHVRLLANDQASNALREDFKSHTLPIAPADNSAIWSSGSRILTKLPADWDLSAPAANQFLIVRLKSMKTSDYLPRVGQFVHVIGSAQAEPNAQPPVVALKVTSATREITAQDLLMPARCMASSFAPIDEPAAPEFDATKAFVTPKVIGFLDEDTIAAREAIVLIDQGSNNQLRVNQIVQFIDVLPNQPASAKPFGEALVLQTFPDMSVVRITQTTHEVPLKAPLRLKP